MDFLLPQFNLTCNVWKDGYVPAVGGAWTGPPGAADYNTRCQLYVSSRNNGGQTIQAFNNPQVFHTPHFFIQLRVPKGTDIFTSPWRPVNAVPTDCVEVPAGSGVFYAVGFVIDIHKGFANEYRAAQIELVYTPRPMP